VRQRGVRVFVAAEFIFLLACLAEQRRARRAVGVFA
jgi:hypothetical protein